MVEDRNLVRRAKRGDQQAFDRIYDAYLDTLLTVALGLLGSPQEAEDAVQDVFTKFIEALPGFRLRGSLKGFLATCVANRCRDQLRRQNRRIRHYDRIGSDRVYETTTSAWQWAMQTEQAERTRLALQKLSLEQREMVVLKIHSGESFRALARQLRLPLGTVQGRYRSGIEKLRHLLNGDKDL